MGDHAYYEIKLLFLKLCEGERCFVSVKYNASVS